MSNSDQPHDHSQIGNHSQIPTPREVACVLVIFGGAGDLSHKKLLPALYNLALEQGLPERFAIVGFSMESLDDDAYRKFARDGIEHFSRHPLTEDGWKRFAPLLHFVSGRFTTAADYTKLKQQLAAIDQEHRTGGSYL